MKFLLDTGNFRQGVPLINGFLMRDFEFFVVLYPRARYTRV